MLAVETLPAYAIVRTPSMIEQDFILLKTEGNIVYGCLLPWRVQVATAITALPLCWSFDDIGHPTPFPLLAHVPLPVR